VLSTNDILGLETFGWSFKNCEKVSSLFGKALINAGVTLLVFVVLHPCFAVVPISDGGFLLMIWMYCSC
jgi:hypothetical protein